MVNTSIKGLRSIAKSALVGIAAFFSTGALAADDWDFNATFYGWLPGLGTTVETPVGQLETALDFRDIFENLDIAAFSALEARKGRIAFVGDVIFTDLGAGVETPFGAAFSKGEVDSQTLLISGYAMFALVEQSNFRIEAGGGLRYNAVNVEARLDGTGGVSDVSVRRNEGWFDPIIAARAKMDFSEKWFGSIFADVGGFGIGDAADLTWQAFAGGGYRINDTWSVVGGYRHLEIDRDFTGVDISLQISGPVVGVQAAF
ncbi:MAG: hypothetical protein AAFR71_00845 [Pseudomonadota bacterium]